MTEGNSNHKPVITMDSDAVSRTIFRLSREVTERHRADDQLAIVGILRRGAILAKRIAQALPSEWKIPVGTLDISLYRDDGRGQPGDPRILGRDIPFSLDGRQVLLVDDVLYTGRTVRAGLAALADLGRPTSVQLLVLVDRGEQQLPIRADYVGRNVAAPAGQRVFVRLKEIDGVDSVVVGETKA
jgi:pyrimidine operon attenuation protein/uracil phosphoribosyltransferase